jgi:ankyrin repeat protein
MMQEGGTALLSAAAAGHEKVVGLLLKSGARINSVSDVSYSFL